jgi:hypothetical protein
MGVVVVVATRVIAMDRDPWDGTMAWVALIFWLALRSSADPIIHIHDCFLR